ncbi:hypothetical protein [Alkalisalibacterium limincola]|uniref:Galactosyldiacylglycerol synthase n=1 Tax=Alkalisalibacterium limincola TaxID=2699169 RepID=A0A5C8KYZ2_9GAMM|nr:hypothetical protein [Alkalisalibacterium limincola]TXK64495.1 hypothetical protein FU658_06315 [Alkalisalibacterium limincola]
MPRIYDRRSGRTLAHLDDAEFKRFMTLFEEPVHDEEAATLDPMAVERLNDAGDAGTVGLLVEQILAGPDDIDIAWDDSTP